MLGSSWLSFWTPATAVWLTSKKSAAYLLGFDASLYSALLIGPRPPPLIWSAIATRPAHCGQLSDVPPMSYQPVWLMLLSVPSGGSDRNTSAPVAALAWKAMSGTPRVAAGIGVLPAGSTLW